MKQTVTVAIINFNGANIVCRSIDSVLAMQGVEKHVICIDDGSTDGSIELVQEKYSEISIYREPENTGRLNMLRNKALRLATTDRVLITDNDILFDPECLAHLIKYMNDDPEVVTCTPRLMYLDEPDRIYAAAGIVHYLGVSVDEGRGRIFEQASELPRANASGGIMLVNKTRMNGVEGFDEEYLMGWGDDGEFYHELMLTGKKCLYVPDAVAQHEEKPFSESRHYRASGQIYNRWRFILTNYSVVTLLLILPALLLFELMQLLFMLAKSMPLIYLRGNLMAFRDMPSFLRRRRQIQRHRRVSDRELLHSGPIFISPSILKGSHLLRLGLRLSNAFFDLYWKLIRQLMPDTSRRIRKTGALP